MASLQEPCNPQHCWDFSPSEQQEPWMVSERGAWCVHFCCGLLPGNRRRWLSPEQQGACAAPGKKMIPWTRSGLWTVDRGQRWEKM